MKFLCVECDEAMKLETTVPPDNGSITAVFRCPTCGRGTAMLTNQWETELVQSLGVTIGPGEKAAGCPFAGTVSASEEATGIGWTQKALQRLDSIPDFVRPMAKQSIEEYARSNDHELVTETVLDEARGLLGMG